MAVTKLVLQCGPLEKSNEALLAKPGHLKLGLWRVSPKHCDVQCTMAQSTTPFSMQYYFRMSNAQVSTLSDHVLPQYCMQLHVAVVR